MERIDFYIQSFLKKINHQSIFEYYQKISTGKRLRSKLILEIVNTDEAYKLCAIIECIHLASLLHDDVIDNSLLRRGKSSINAIFGDKTAIMLGDILYSSAFFELCDFDKKIAKKISHCVCMLASGELMDVELSLSFNDNFEKYLTMIYRKTAVLIEVCCVCAAILAKKDFEKYAIYGKNLGLSFQIIDDLLDVKSEEKILGKPAFADFSEGKSNIVYIFLYEALNQKDRKILLSYFKKPIDEKMLLWIKAKCNECDIFLKVQNLAINYANIAKKAIENENNNRLLNLIDKMIFRDF